MMSSVNHEDFAHLKIPLEDVLSATNNFDDKNLVGEDAYEKVYKVQLLWSGELIDILARRFKEWDEKEQQFWMEISMLSSLKHKNLVSLVGFCDENDEKIIITRGGNRGSLFNHLSYSILLTWVRRLEICVGIAHALSYIHYHESRDFSLIRRDINRRTIVLNDKWQPQLYSMHSFHIDSIWYAQGYADATYFKTGSVNQKSDIYSFGIVMFELLCGRNSVIDDDRVNKYLASVAVTHYREKKLNEIIDWDLWNQMDSQSFNIFAEIAYDCLNEERSQRPHIDEIVKRLEKALKLQLEHQNEIMKEFAHLRVPLESILSATNNFADGNVISRGGIGNRYKGQLWMWSGELIDILARRLNKELDDGEQQFWTEISMLSSLKHKNVVSLVGFCDENDEKIIITRHNTRGSLSNYLSDPILLTWVRRLEISVGIVQALSYIHYDEPRDFSVIHRHIDSSRILLNDDWEPKLSSFECSMKIEASKRHNSFHTNNLVYVEGYGDPTYIETKSVNHNSDIYSFGIVLFELLCGRRSIIDAQDNNKYLAPLVITHYREKRLDGIIDWDLWNQMDLQSFEIFAETAYECLNEERSQRPNIDEIVKRLRKALELQLEHQNEIMKEFAHLRIPLENILSATNNFAQGNLWGIGDFANLYKGQLLWSGELIDIQAQRWNKEWDGKEQQFWMEISMLSSLKHKNVVSLVGFCDENDEKIIIFKLDTRLSLSNYLSDPISLTWVRRLEISVGVAHALSYIHYDEPRDFSVIHRRIISGRVLLNDEWEPKLCDFRCSMKIKASERHQSFYTCWSNVLLELMSSSQARAYVQSKKIRAYG